jgi:hypothetical protein
MRISISPKVFRRMVIVQSVLESPRVFIGEKLGLIMPQSGWDYIKTRIARNYEVGIEIRKGLPPFNSRSELEKLANEGLRLTLHHFGDFLVDACIKIREGPLWPDEGLRIGHYIDMEIERDYTKHIQIDIIYSKETNSYAIIAFVYKHMVDAVPVIFLLYHIHNYIILKEQSYIYTCERKPAFNLGEKLKKFRFTVDKQKWDFVLPKNNNTFLNVGAQVNIKNSNIRKLRRQIFLELGLPVSTSSLELALIGIDTGLNFALDCVAVGNKLINNKVDITGGYKRLAHVATRGYNGIDKLDPDGQYLWLLEILKESSAEMGKALAGKGKSAWMFDRIRNIPDYARLFSDTWSSYDCIMETAGSQLLGTNLNGVDYGVQLAVGSIKPEDIRGIGIPSNPEHTEKIKEIRNKKGLNADITEFVFAHGQLVKGTDFVFKSIKTNKKVATEILRKWGEPVEGLDKLSLRELVVKLFNLMYQPSDPMEGRIEKLAGKYLKLGKKAVR